MLSCIHTVCTARALNFFSCWLINNRHSLAAKHYSILPPPTHILICSSFGRATVSLYKKSLRKVRIRNFDESFFSNELYKTLHVTLDVSTWTIKEEEQCCETVSHRITACRVDDSLLPKWIYFPGPFALNSLLSQHFNFLSFLLQVFHNVTLSTYILPHGLFRVWPVTHLVERR